MQTKRTPRLDDDLSRQAKQHAKQAGRTVPLAPKVAELMGALENARVDEADYDAYLEKKYLYAPPR